MLVLVVLVMYMYMLFKVANGNVPPMSSGTSAECAQRRALFGPLGSAGCYILLTMARQWQMPDIEMAGASKRMQSIMPRIKTASNSHEPLVEFAERGQAPA
ncbi:hypothetical protein CDD81_930 [Ophiocordyceps australis]|uniref:Uncharacterized protein n=1 Tax=Ophiocordyceps australis TaxID=1399860 RepID=A0A2C5YFB6_9HYPO|nr:hypothetical protein CDD81_930 [Ophiocordyceps australis]